MNGKDFRRLMKRIGKGNAFRVESAEGRTVSAESRRLAAAAICDGPGAMVGKTVLIGGTAHRITAAKRAGPNEIAVTVEPLGWLPRAPGDPRLYDWTPPTEDTIFRAWAKGGK